MQGAVQTGLAVRLLSGAGPSVAGLAERLLLLKLVSRELQTCGSNPLSSLRLPKRSFPSLSHSLSLPSLPPLRYLLLRTSQPLVSLRCLCV